MGEGMLNMMLKELHERFGSRVNDKDAYRQKDIKALVDMYLPLIPNDDDLLSLPRSTAPHLEHQVVARNDWITSLGQYIDRIIKIDGESAPEINRIKVLINEMKNSPANNGCKMLRELGDRCSDIFYLWALKKRVEQENG